MLSLRFRVSSRAVFKGPVSSLTRSVFQFANSGHNPRTTILLTNLRDDVTLASLKDSLKDIREIQKVKLQPGCALHYVKQEDASKSLDILAKLNYTVRLNIPHSLTAIKIWIFILFFRIYVLFRRD